LSARKQNLKLETTTEVIYRKSQAVKVLKVNTGRQIHCCNTFNNKTAQPVVTMLHIEHCSIARIKWAAWIVINGTLVVTSGDHVTTMTLIW